MTIIENEKPEKVTEATRFSYQGEFLDLTPEVGYDLRARYRQAAIALHAAKDEAFKIEEEIKQAMGGYERARVNGEVIFTWLWGMATKFDKRGLHNKYPQIHDEFVTKTPHGNRTFKAPDVSGVE